MEGLVVGVLEAAEPPEVGNMWFKKKDTDLKCPRCDKVMRKIKKADVVIDVCDTCHGMWLDEGEIDKLAALGKPNGKKE